MERLQSDYNLAVSMGYEVVGVFLQGSQNYGLAYENSDIDTKVIVLPKFDDFVVNAKPVSTTHVLPSNEHMDLKDIRLMFECFRKQNINFVEVLFTEYHILNEKYAHLFEPLMEHAERIARYDIHLALNCMAGMSLEKFKALEHPYPATKDKIEKFGYDPKQLHHIIRLNRFMKAYIAGKSYATCLKPKDVKFLIEVKRGRYCLEEARFIAKALCEEAVAMKNKYIENNPVEVDKKVEDLLTQVLVDCLSTSFASRKIKQPHRTERAYTVTQGGLYKHSKTGNTYRVFEVCTHTETQERLVIYGDINKVGFDGKPYEMWARPKAMFEGFVEIDGKRVPRFQSMCELDNL